MKFLAALLISFSFAVQAFGVSSDPAFARKQGLANTPTFHPNNKQVATSSRSPLFRDSSVVRAGAVPGWAAYNEALGKLLKCGGFLRWYNRIFSTRGADWPFSCGLRQTKSLWLPKQWLPWSDGRWVICVPR